MTKSFVYLTVSLMAFSTGLAFAQDGGEANPNLCAEITLRYDTELMATPADQLDRSKPLPHETKLNDLHIRKLERAISDCGEPAGISISGVSTNGPNSLSGPVVQRQMAARRISGFSAWAVERGIPRDNLALGSNGALEPWPAAMILELSFETPKEVVLLKPEPAPQLVIQPERPAPKVQQQTEAETLTQTVESGAPKEIAAPEPVELGPCEAPFLVTFGSAFSKEDSLNNLRAHLNECGEEPGFSLTFTFEELNISNYAAWLSWNVALGGELRPLAMGN